MDSLRFFATAPRGVTDLLATELSELGATSVADNRAGVEFEGTLETAYRACLWSRLANRILLPLAEFEAADPDALYEGCQAIDWSAHMNSNGTLAIDANVSNSRITHSHYASLRIKDAIVDQFNAKVGHRPGVDTERPDLRINAYIHRDVARIYVDLSGASLHQRGYRLGTGEAPLKENLAAAILLRAGWPEIARQGGALVDPMCGSGTLVLEAAMMAGDVAPGLRRTWFGLTRWKQHDDALWQRLISEACDREAAGLKRMPTLLGFDADRRVLDRARENAERLDIPNLNFIYQDLFDFRHDFPDSGLVVTNPPYGRRLMDSGDLPRLYSALGQVLRTHFQGWSAAVFTEEQKLGKSIGIRSHKQHTLYNGAIACRLLHFAVDADNFFDDSRLPKRLKQDELSPQSQDFSNRLQKNLKQRKRWAEREGIECYRIYDADLPDYAAAIDCYGNRSNPEQQWVCIQEYEAPKKIDPDLVKRRTRELRTIAQDVLDLDESQLFYKSRARQRGENQYEKLASESRFHVVTEGACKLRVNFTDYVDTGLFLDHRPVRQLIEQQAKGRRFLNLFAYTGAATIHAAVGGASSSLSIDLSNTYLDWAKRNLQLNKLDESKHRLLRADCLQWLKQDHKESWDLIFLDPPTFSNSKRMDDLLDIQRDHVQLIERSMRLLAEDGTLYFSTNLRSFKLDEQLAAQFKLTDISMKSIPEDFQRRSNIHFCFAIEHVK
jgi:23S rRNA (guanine2445-N2)-methyltransferase / 23S rRNA (guanine2069-N7)-methyltransferase